MEERIAELYEVNRALAEEGIWLKARVAELTSLLAERHWGEMTCGQPGCRICKALWGEQ